MNEKEKLTPEFSNQEVEALLKLVTEKEEVVAEPTAVKEVEVYDFRKPERVSKDQLHILSMFYEGLCRNLATNLSTLTRAVVECEVKISEQVVFSEFIASIPNPTCISLLSMRNQEKITYLDLNYSILFPLIDRIIGGPGYVSSIPTQPLTEIEWELANTILAIIVDNLNKSWLPIKNMDFKITKQDSNPFLIQPLQPNEPIIRISILIKFKNYSGYLTIGHPYIFYEDVLPYFSTRVWLASQKKSEESREDTILKLLSPTELTIKAKFPAIIIKLKEFLNWTIGSYIILPQITENDIILEIGNTSIFKGKLGKLSNKYAVQIQSVIKQK
jgi:flagellar motor switch protein FliM